MSDTRDNRERPLDGKVAFVSGAARGQGRAHAVRLAQDGADIIGFDLCDHVETTKCPPSTEVELAETVRLVEATGRRMIPSVADVRSSTAVRAAFEDGVERLGRVDIVIANAGILSCNLSWEITDEQWQTMIDVNLTGVFNTVRVAVPRLIEQGDGGVIIMTASIAGLRGLPYQAHYVAAKHGVVGLARSMAIELSRYDIRVHTIHPNGVDTHMLDDPDIPAMLFEDEQGMKAASNALPYRRAQPEDVAGVVSFLASHEARYMTGAPVMLDMGNSLM
ncbi:MAG: mycofactocin-coupled SDR family oxidoreductase [Acidobacteria bacterium]|nr:mycofactocin-coupled SDR family oxidoreductase [Acidobacteriota bacterium]